MLAQSPERRAGGGKDDHLPIRQNRRTPSVEAAPAPFADQPEKLTRLRHALALITGSEAMMVFRDGLQIDDTEALQVKRLAIRALVDAALREYMLYPCTDGIG